MGLSGFPIALTSLQRFLSQASYILGLQLVYILGPSKSSQDQAPNRMKVFKEEGRKGHCSTQNPCAAYWGLALESL